MLSASPRAANISAWGRTELHFPGPGMLLARSGDSSAPAHSVPAAPGLTGTRTRCPGHAPASPKVGKRATCLAPLPRAAKPDCSTQIWGALGGVAPLPEDAEEGVSPPSPLPFWAGDTHQRRASGEMCEELLSGTAPIPAALGHHTLAGRGQRGPWLDKYGWAGSRGANGRYSSSPQLNDELVNSCVSLVCTKGIEPLFVCFLS